MYVTLHILWYTKYNPRWWLIKWNGMSVVYCHYEDYSTGRRRHQSGTPLNLRKTSNFSTKTSGKSAMPTFVHVFRVSLRHATNFIPRWSELCRIESRARPKSSSFLFSSFASSLPRAKEGIDHISPKLHLGRQKCTDLQMRIERRRRTRRGRKRVGYRLFFAPFSLSPSNHNNTTSKSRAVNLLAQLYSSTIFDLCRDEMPTQHGRVDPNSATASVLGCKRL